MEIIYTNTLYIIMTLNVSNKTFHPNTDSQIGGGSGGCHLPSVQKMSIKTRRPFMEKVLSFQTKSRKLFELKNSRIPSVFWVWIFKKENLL
jgi:hypothetical protein